MLLDLAERNLRKDSDWNRAGVAGWRSGRAMSRAGMRAGRIRVSPYFSVFAAPG